MAESDPDNIDSEIKELRDIINKYNPGKQVPSNINFPSKMYIGLFGRTGSGKTSLMNSLRYAIDGSFRRGLWAQIAPQTKMGGMTMYRTEVALAPSINIIDNRGLDDPSDDTVRREIEAQLDGLKSPREMVDWQSNSRSSTQIGKWLACSILVLSAAHDVSTTLKGLGGFVDFLMEFTSRYPMAVITHVDTEDGPENRSALIKGLELNGVGDIYEVANLTNNRLHLNKKDQLTLLRLMDRCMTEADERFFFSYRAK